MNSSVQPVSRLAAIIAGLVVFGWGFWQQRQHELLRREVAELRTMLLAPAKLPAPSESAPGVAEAKAPVSDEILALRNEVATLRRQWMEKAAPAGPAPVAGEKAPLPAFMRHGWIEAAGLPAPVLNTFRQQLGDVPIEGAHVKQSEGRFYYSTEAKLADGRHMELSMDDAGNVVRRSLETPLEALATPVQQAVLAALGDSTDPRRINEVFDDGRTVYRVTAKNPEQATIFVFTPDGEMLRSEVIRREDRP